MRYMKLRDLNGGFAQAQKREEREMFRCYFIARGLARMDGHQRNLDLVRDNLIEGSNDLTIKVFENFLDVCVELGVDINLDIFKFDETHPGKGNGYRIPSKKKDAHGHRVARAKRNRWRKEFREFFGDEDVATTEPVTGIDKIAQLKVIQGGVR